MVQRHEVTQSVMSQCDRQDSEVTSADGKQNGWRDLRRCCALLSGVSGPEAELSEGQLQKLKQKLSFRVLTMTQVPENPDVLEGKLGLRQAARRQTYQTQRL